MKKKKILNIRRSLITGALTLTTLLTGCGLLKNNSDISSQDPTKSENPSSSSSTIIDNNNGNGHEQDLPGGVVIDPITDDPNIDPIDTNKDPVINEGPTGTPGSTTTKPSTNNQGSSSTGTGTEKPEEPGVTDPSVTEPGVETPGHTHTLGEWVSISDYLEGSYCPEDGTLMRVRNHKYEITDTKAVSNNNGTHNNAITATCINCNHTKTFIKENVECKDLTLTWDSTYEYETCNECGYKETIGKHNLDKGTIKDNQIIYTCKNEGCGFTDTKAYNPGHSHSGNNGGGSNTPTRPGAHTHTYGEWSAWSEWAITTDAEGNKIEYRTRTKSCSECGYTEAEKQTRPYNPGHTHNWSEWSITKQATCTEDGEKTRTCAVDGCTVKIETETISALGHDMGAYTTTKNPTCIEKGIETSSCSRCDHTATKEISALGHSYGELTVSEDWHVVTKEDGSQVEERTLEQTCSVCGNKKTTTEERPYTPGHTHTWGNWTYLDENTEQRVCADDSTHIETQGHNYGTSITGTASGEYVTCDSCNHTKKIGDHNLSVSGKNSNVVTMSCDNDGCNYSTTHTHDTSEVSQSNACGANSRDIKCSTCNETYTVYKDHQWTFVEEFKGENWYECVCGKEKHEPIQTNSITNPTNIGNPEGNNPEQLEMSSLDLEQNVGQTQINPDLNSNLGENVDSLEDTAGSDVKTDDTKDNAETPATPDTPVTPEQPAEDKDEITEVIESGKEEADRVIETGSKEVEQIIEAGDKEVEQVMERSEAELQERMAQADAELAALLSNSSFTRVRRLF